MAFADPQKVKIGASEKTLPRVNTGNFSSTYLSSDGLTKLTISTQVGKRKRHTYRVDVEKTTADPFIPADNVAVSMSTYVVIDRPLVGYSNAEALEVVVGMLNAAIESEDSDLVKLLGSES